MSGAGSSIDDTANQQDVLLSCVNDFCCSLHVQAEVMRRCIGLHGPTLPPAFHRTLEGFISNLAVAIERSRGDLSSASGITTISSSSYPMIERAGKEVATGQKPLKPSRPWCGPLELCTGSGNRDHRIDSPRSSNDPEELRLAFDTAAPFFPAPGRVRRGIALAHVAVQCDAESSIQDGGVAVTAGVHYATEISDGTVGEAEVSASSKPSRELAEKDVIGSGHCGGEVQFESYRSNTEITQDATASQPMNSKYSTGRSDRSDKGASAEKHWHSIPSAQSMAKRISDAAGFSRGTRKPSRRPTDVTRASGRTTEMTNAGTSGTSATECLARRMSLSEQFESNEIIGFEEVTGKCVEGTMNPNWPGRLGWDLAVILLVVFDAMVLPWQMAYKHNKGPDLFDNSWLWLTTCFFALDMFMSFFTAYTAGNQEPGVDPGKLVTSRYRIARNYIRSWFSVDFASTIPWGKFADLMTGGGSESKSAQTTKLIKVVKFVRFLRLMRMLRLAKLVHIWERVEANMGSFILKQCVAMLKVLSVLVGICHWNACIWFMIGSPGSLIADMMSENVRKDWEGQPHWTTVKDSKGFIWSESPPFQQYIFCFYWTLGVMRTMPSEVTPTNSAERMYIMIFMFFAFSAFAICVALITQTFFKFSERNRIFSEDMAAVREYMRNINAPSSVQSPVKAFLQHLFDRRRIQAKELNMMANLPTNLSGLLKQAKLENVIKKLDVLEDLPEKAKFYISELCEIKDMARGTCLCRRDRYVDAAYVLMYGRLDDKDNPEDGPVEVLHPECLKSPKLIVSQKTVISVSCSEVARFDRAKFFNLLKSHDDFKRSISFVVDMDDGSLDEIHMPNIADTQHLDTMAATAAVIAS